MAVETSEAKDGGEEEELECVSELKKKLSISQKMGNIVVRFLGRKMVMA